MEIVHKSQTSDHLSLFVIYNTREQLTYLEIADLRSSMAGFQLWQAIGDRTAELGSSMVTATFVSTTFYGWFSWMRNIWLKNCRQLFSNVHTNTFYNFQLWHLFPSTLYQDIIFFCSDGQKCPMRADLKVIYSIIGRKKYILTLCGSEDE